MSETIVRVTRVIEISPDGVEVDVTHELEGEVLEYIKSAREGFGLSDDEIEQDLIAHFACMSHPYCCDDVEIIGDTVRLYAFDLSDEEDWRSLL
ncbi:hypothetical protein JJL56_02020 [Azospirillum sp. YIM DDC1]|uniref:Uncharacterized protein n=1 Tax=Azospirillum aestuarii TaxID=2802052 RepID=A0ABS1HS33_9PROT|nr:hypothetical protein [Azospirillum aestuarii]MBK4717636.1 hypothetical protein [Azospirillum aestuarii]